MDQQDVVRDALAALDTSADAFAEHLTENAEFLTPSGQLQGREEIRQFVAGMYASFSEWKHDVTIKPGGRVDDRPSVRGRVRQPRGQASTHARAARVHCARPGLVGRLVPVLEPLAQVA